MPNNGMIIINKINQNLKVNFKFSPASNTPMCLCVQLVSADMLTIFLPLSYLLTANICKKAYSVNIKQWFTQCGKRYVGICPRTASETSWYHRHLRHT
jgi:hypothetical protein